MISMTSKPALFALLAVACFAAAGGGAYVATRQHAASQPAAETASGPQPASGAGAEAPLPSTDTVVPLDGNADAAARAEEAVAHRSGRRLEPGRASSSGRASRPRGTVSDRREPSKAPAEVGSSPAAATEPVSAPDAPPPVPAPDPREATTLPAPERTTAERVDGTPERDPVPPARTFEDVVVAADAVIGLQLETTVTSERARVEDRVEARVTRDVTVGDRTAIPAGARMIGSVTLVERGGKVRERARLGVRFHTLVLADGTTIPVQTGTIFRDGESPAGESAAKIGGAAVGGAILGAIFGGTKGAIVGGTTGAAGGTAVVMAGDRRPAILTAGSDVTVRLSAPVTVAVER